MAPETLPPAGGGALEDPRSFDEPQVRRTGSAPTLVPSRALEVSSRSRQGSQVSLVSGSEERVWSWTEV